MKILIVSPKFHPVVGGGETFVLNSAQELHRAGHEVLVAVEPHERRNAHQYKFPVKEVAGLSDDSLQLVPAVDGLFSLIEAFKPDIIHAHGYFALLVVGLCKPISPLVASIHSTPVWGERLVGGMSDFKQEESFARTILSFVKPDIVTAANSVYLESAQRLASPPTKAVIFPYPILPIFYRKHGSQEFRTIFELKPNDVLLCVPSRIIERKGIMEAVESLHYLPENYYLCLPCAVHPMDKDYWLSVQRVIGEQSLDQRILLPKQEILHEDMPRLYAASDIVLMPSYYEGAPVATVEAMAARIPFIGANCQGINGFIRDGENGLLVPIHDPKALSNAILRLSSDKNLQHLFIEQAAKDVEALSWSVQLKKLEELYASLL